MPAAIEQPALHAASFDGNVPGRKCFEFAMLGTKREAELASKSVSARRIFDATAGGAKCIAPWVSFEVNAQQPWIHGEQPLSKCPYD